MPRTEGRSDRESIQVTYLGESSSGKAWKVCLVGKTSECWVPISQCALVPENPSEGDTVWLMIPQWLLAKTEELT
jgi:hypothetical protein